MKDKALLCLLLGWLPWAPGADGQVQILRFGNPNFGAGGTPAQPEKMPEPRGDVLEFWDGSALHGSLAAMSLQDGLTWLVPEASGPIHFRPDHLSFLRFSHAQAVSMKPTCHLWFGNGDDLYGSISSLDNEKLGFNTWFGGTMTIPRPAVRAITFLSPNFSVVYEGPYDTGGWEVINSTPNSWTFHDGAFIGAGPGTLGREMGLANSCSVDFDVSWNTFFTLDVGIYCDAIDRMDFNTGSCLLNLTPARVSLNQVDRIGGPFSQAGVPVPVAEGKTAMHVGIECDKENGTVSVFVNHNLIKTWKDCNFSGAGTGILFMQRTMFSSATLKLSHLKVSQWQGRCEPETSSPATNSDAVYLVNNDKAAGKIESIADGKARLALAGTVLDIPLDRITQMDFAESKVPAETPGPWQVRAHFPGGGSISFQLEKWNDQGLAGRSAIFGALAFQPNSVREMEFNLGRAKEDSVVTQAKDFEELDE
ncbi:MAG TPA: hypothetical protein VGO59_02870 [Verrucomicrobiae bacterium]|jgi:hypothetical protein